jgi:shikimate dehydrogenase
VGHPIGHSLSPALHRAAYDELGFTGWTYEVADLAPGELAAFLASQPWAGVSVTMPLKGEALSLATVADPVAYMVGGANTLLPRPDGTWRATNTDVSGMVEALREAGIARGKPLNVPSTSTIGFPLSLAASPFPHEGVILGGGATAAAAVVALARAGLTRIEAWVRDPARAEHLMRLADDLALDLTLRGIMPGQAAPRAAVVVSTLPAHAADPYARTELAGIAGAVLLDAAYEPWPSALARAWAGAGGTVVPGLVMLLHQAARQVELMTGRLAPLEAMRAALEAARPGGTAIVREPMPAPPATGATGAIPVVPGARP